MFKYLPPKNLQFGQAYSVQFNGVDISETGRGSTELN